MDLEKDHRLELLKTLINNAVKGLKDSNIIIRDPSEDEVHGWATLIFESMTTRNRAYHDVTHIFSVFKDIKEPLLILAVLFHDVIYYDLDGQTFSDTQARILSDVIETSSSGSRTLELAQLGNDPSTLMVTSAFGIEKGKGLPTEKGTNEFLSALLAVRILSPILTKLQLLQITACIEATIPFRLIDSEGKSAMDRLYDRLVRTNEVVFSPSDHLTDEQLEGMVHNAVHVANCDLSTFSTTDFPFFMDQNMLLLPEFYRELRHPDCTVSEYYDALIRFHNRQIDYDKIFVSFRGVPSEEKIEAWTQQTKNNMALSNKYIRVRIFSISFLLEVTTTAVNNNNLNNQKKRKCDIPFRSLALIEKKCVEKNGKQQQKQQKQHECHSQDWNSKIHDLFVKSKEEGWGVVASPLCAFIYEKLGQKGVDDALEENGAYKNSGYILKVLPPDLIMKAKQAIAQVLGQEDAFKEIVRK